MDAEMVGAFGNSKFVVPSGQIWQIDGIYAPGIYTSGAGPAPDFDVTVYSDICPEWK